MINTERTKELRIKRANTDWWLHEKAMVADNGKTYITYCTDMGEIHIKELDAKCSKVPSRDYRLSKLNYSYSDEHNTASLCVMNSGKIFVGYTGHYVHALKYRVTEKPYDIFSFGEETLIQFDGTVTYVQVFENTVKHELWLFTRVNYVNWQFCYSRDEGKTWSKPRNFLHSDDGGLFYIDIRKQHIITEKGVDEQWLFALYGHPRISKDHTIRSGIFNSNGILTRCDGTLTGLNLYDETEETIDLENLDIVYESPEGTTVRLLDVSPTLPLRVAFAPFILDKEDAPSPEYAYYCSASFRDGKWNVSEPICTAGEFLANDVLDGSQTYLGGMAYYYGVGDAGLFPLFHKPTFTDRIFITRFDGKNRVVESYLSQNYGKSYELEQVIRRVEEKDVKTWRPIVPVYAQDNMPVYWHEGVYNCHTGGWHCDAVMLVEYDD